MSTTLQNVRMRFPDDRLATFTCSFGAADTSRYRLIGTKGALTAEPAYDYSEALKHYLTVEGKTTVREFAKRDQFAPELIYFSGCILNHEEPEPSGREGMADVRIIEAIYESARTGKRVELPPFPKKHRPDLEQQIRRPAHPTPRTVKANPPSVEAA